MTIFANNNDNFLDKMELDNDGKKAPNKAKFEFSTNVHEKLLMMLKETENLEMGGVCAILKHLGFIKHHWHLYS